MLQKVERWSAEERDNEVESLAKSDPDKAVQNADSHEYLCEQDPAC